ncbi:hypothetical protein G3N55_06595 [Dissulfurirhabdus thermomarina]|uniref:Uncharacterized protein n=1 Tax=Dissulfurirhabdus thermomarina TaxID=1765737 RepID=A0A6N9TMZ3_DISTH|nr:hypothetical protein [Dissulfurirhabdus thermomarina]NDY42509.1 hypothetical protein [Dissulfurirhabdus thermomarina]NMX24196.1 hypothetical protein [Dissulfurirhabdus thermomarina]
MKDSTYVREECLRQTVEIAKAYAQSGENKHGPMTEFLDAVYRKLIELREDLDRETPGPDRA